MKRIAYFLITNLAIMLLLSITVKLLGIDSYLGEYGLNYGSLLIFSVVFGMGGAFLSLQISRWSAKRATGAVVIENPASEPERWLSRTVQELATRAGLPMPEVAYYDSPDINAFATGPSKKRSLVAVSTGLMMNMDRDQARAVLSHEISHISNGDMVTLALMQGVLNTFVLFLSRVIGSIVDRTVFKSEKGNGIAYFVVSFAAEIVLGILASIVVMWFSRKREYGADAGAASLVGSDAMISALRVIESSYTQPALPKQLAAFGISGTKKKGILYLLSTHPDIGERIEALKKMRTNKTMD